MQSRFASRLFAVIATSALLSGTFALAQDRPAPPKQPASPVQLQAVPTESDVAATQSELIKLLRLSPTLTSVISRDPSLLSNQEYVTHNNPQLAAFLASHPEVARNPEFYLFSHLNHADGSPGDALERQVWPGDFHEESRPAPFGEFLNNLSPLLAFAAFLVAVLWFTRVFLENRRWGRIFKLQSEVHGRLIDKFGSNQELASYMETEAGKRFLEAAPIPVNIESGQRVPNAVARVLTPLQIGVVLVLLGIGLLLLRHSSADMEIPMLVFGTVVLMPGIGFIISAGLTWVLAARLGLMPDNSGHDSPYSSSIASKGR
ncbi:MAG TPA: hypothetical protein VKR52_13940 [Terracidiphilus sp.]|nr:hypothetical protein [Terracidiphilus sp.]